MMGKRHGGDDSVRNEPTQPSSTPSALLTLPTPTTKTTEAADVQVTEASEEPMASELLPNMSLSITSLGGSSDSIPEPASPASPNPFGEIPLFTGYLIKKGANFPYQWQRRFFELYPTKRLCYYEEVGGHRQLAGTLYLYQVTLEKNDTLTWTGSMTADIRASRSRSGNLVLKSIKARAAHKGEIERWHKAVQSLAL